MAFRKGNQALSALKSRLRAMPVTVADKVAKRVAPSLSSLSGGAYDAGRTVYGEGRPKGVDGAPLDLVDTGDTRKRTFFVADGRVVRASLGTDYAPYLIGKYRILPNGPIPVGWKREIDAIVHKTKVYLK